MLRVLKPTTAGGYGWAGGGVFLGRGAHLNKDIVRWNLLMGEREMPRNAREG